MQAFRSAEALAFTRAQARHANRTFKVQRRKVARANIDTRRYRLLDEVQRSNKVCILLANTGRL